MSNLRRAPPHLGPQAHRIQVSTSHPQHDQVQIHDQVQTHHQLQSPRPQHMNNRPSLRRKSQQHPTPHPTRLVAHPIASWPLNPYTRQRGSNEITHNRDLFVTGSAHSAIPQALNTTSSAYTAWNCEYFQDFYDRRYQSSYMGPYSSTNGAMHWNESNSTMIDPGLRPTGLTLPVMRREVHASNDPPRGSRSWASANSPQESIMGDANEDNYSPECDSSSPEDQPFLTLPGYHGEKNNYGLFDCFEDCMKGRLGRRGFSRRANMLVHLRNCHGQEVPRGSRA